MTQNQDLKWLRLALAHANRHKNEALPNPTVAALVVKNNRLIAKGLHKKCGTPHAEAVALTTAGKKAKNATLYVTLEPCTHFGRTPPCVDAIIRSGIKRVVYAVDDPNPKTRANPAAPLLAAAGITVKKNLLQNEATVLNEIFFKNITDQLPFVTLKAALSLDGKIALSNRKSKYLTNESSLKKVHQLRSQAQAIIIGINTLLHDDPQLNIRHIKSPHNPIKIILDTQGKTPPTARIFKANPDTKIIIATTKKIAPDRFPKNTEFWLFKSKSNQIPWAELLKRCYQNNISSVLIEGGEKIFSSALKSNSVDKVILFYAPILIGDPKAIPLFSSQKQLSLKNTLRLYNIFHQNLDNNLYVSGYLKPQ